MDFGVILIILFLIGSSIYKNYKQQMEKSRAATTSVSGKNGAVPGKTGADKMLQNIISEIEKSRGTFTGSDKEDIKDELSGKSSLENENMEGNEDESLVAIFSEDERKRDTRPQKTNKKIVPDYGDAGSLSTGFIYATVLGKPACKRLSSSGSRRNL